MQLIDRVQSILLRPKQTWPVIAAESTDTARLYTGYIMILAAIPAVAKFIGLSLLGFSVLWGIGQLVIGYLLSLLMVFVLALIVDALAPTFGGVKNRMQALKLVAYAWTAYFLGGVFYLLPVLGLLALVAACYSVYLLYTGIAVMMRCPPDKAGAYTAVVIVCAIVAGILIGVVVGLFAVGGIGGLGGYGRVAGGPMSNVTINAPDGSRVTLNGGAMAEMAQRMSEAGKRMEAAQKSGDGAATNKAMGDMMGAIVGGNSKPMPAADLKAMLPEAIGGLRRNSIEASSGEAMGLGGSTANASYVNGEQRLRLTITDTGGLAGLANVAGWANMTVDKESDGKIEKIYKQGNRTAHEDYAKDGSHGEYSLILGNGVVVVADGDRVGIDDLKKAVDGVDLGKIETVKRVAR